MLSLADNIDKILNGTEEEKTALKQKFFKMADTPQFLKDVGLTGDAFTIKYGVISRHKNKDSDHSFTVNEWQDICDKITTPHIVAKHGKDFSLFLNMKKNNKNVLVGIDVKSVAKNVEVNAVKTVFAKDFNLTKDDIVYYNKNCSTRHF